MATENLETAFIVLAIGMITVFVVLGLVVLTGQLLIKIVNALHKETEPAPASPAGIPSTHIAVITAAVAQLSEGKASVLKIEKK